MDLELSDKRALITGGSKGIGRATANLRVKAADHCFTTAKDDSGQLQSKHRSLLVPMSEVSSPSRGSLTTH